MPIRMPCKWVVEVALLRSWTSFCFVGKGRWSECGTRPRRKREASETVRVKTPTVSRRLDAWMRPSEERRPRVGLKPMMPDFSAGETME
jgi:hypothetical protein